MWDFLEHGRNCVGKEEWQRQDKSDKAKTKGYRYGKEILLKAGVDPGNLINNMEDGTCIKVILIP